jgi:glycosyltransferase involved in cell wall biosynthesis
MTKLMCIIHSLKGGGSERVLINLLKGLKRDKFSITLVLYERVFDYPLPEDVEVRILDIYASRNIFKLAKGFALKIMCLAKLIRRDKPEVIFSLLSSTNITVLFAALLSRIKSKVIVSEHTYPSVNLRNEMYGGVVKSLIKKMYPHAHKIIAVSEGIKQDLIHNFHIRDDKIEVVYNPIDTEEIKTLSREELIHPWFQEQIPIIVSVGRLTKQKGYPYLLRAFSLVRKSLPCRLFIIGEGEDKKKLVQMAHKLDLKEDIEFCGFQKNPFKYMARSSLFILSSLYEGFPNVLLEAMALGLPIISTDCPSGPTEIIEDKKNGLLVPAKDENALSQAIITLLRDSDLRNSLGREAKTRASSFALDKIITRYREIFLENLISAL